MQSKAPGRGKMVPIIIEIETGWFYWKVLINSFSGFRQKCVPFNFYWTTLDFSHNREQFCFMSSSGISLLASGDEVCIFKSLLSISRIQGLKYISSYLTLDGKSCKITYIIQLFLRPNLIKVIKVHLLSAAAKEMPIVSSKTCKNRETSSSSIHPSIMKWYYLINVCNKVVSWGTIDTFCLQIFKCFSCGIYWFYILL